MRSCCLIGGRGRCGKQVIVAYRDFDSPFHRGPEAFAPCLRHDPHLRLHCFHWRLAYKESLLDAIYCTTFEIHYGRGGPTEDVSIRTTKSLNALTNIISRPFATSTQGQLRQSDYRSQCQTTKQHGSMPRASKCESIRLRCQSLAATI